MKVKFVYALLVLAFIVLPCPSEAAFYTPAFLDLCEKGTLQEVEAAIKAGADIHAKTQAGGNTALMLALDNPNPGVVSALIKAGVDVNAKGGASSNGCTALMMYVSYKKSPQLQVIAELIKSGADVNAKCQAGTPLVAALNINMNPELQYGLLEMLIKAGADVNARMNIYPNMAENTVLMFASSNPNVGTITALIKAGADVNAKNKYGWTALMLAAETNRNPQIIITLIESGADINIKARTAYGEERAIDLAYRNQNLRKTEAFTRLNALTTD